MPQRIQLSRKKGWRMPGNAVSVARPGPFGNPYPVTDERSADRAVSAFVAHLANTPSLQEMVARRLPGKDLACWCAIGQPCHADILLAAANPGFEPQPFDTSDSEVPF
ncbi:DUF4326 domain-containing protein [Sphingomonas paucimobilis]|uniref:DUF4326 domain-containing protein n=1 Tax=Sphingomonas paucimobilis TaxID=13689 RepID=UPI0037962535